jgi:hypothetical protein
MIGIEWRVSYSARNFCFQMEKWNKTHAFKTPTDPDTMHMHQAMKEHNRHQRPW